MGRTLDKQRKRRYPFCEYRGASFLAYMPLAKEEREYGKKVV